MRHHITAAVLAGAAIVGTAALTATNAAAAPLEKIGLGNFSVDSMVSCGAFCTDWSLTYTGPDDWYDAFWYTQRVGTSSGGADYSWNDGDGVWEFGGTEGAPAGDYTVSLDYSLIDTSTTGTTNGASAGSLLPAISIGDLSTGDSFSLRSAYTLSGESNGFFATSWIVASAEDGQVPQIPLPATLPLLGIGLIALGAMARRRS